MGYYKDVNVSHSQTNVALMVTYKLLNCFDLEKRTDVYHFLGKFYVSPLIFNVVIQYKTFLEQTSVNHNVVDKEVQLQIFF